MCPSGAFTHSLLPPQTFAKARKAPEAETIALWMKDRRSVRRYKDTPVPLDLIERVLDIARYAPSGHNTQSVEWVVVADRPGVTAVNAQVARWSRAEVDEKSDLAKKLNLAGALRAYGHGRDVICRGAPALVLAHGPAEGITPREDGAIAVAWLELAARAVGLASCFAGYVTFAANAYAPLSEALGLSAARTVYGAAMLGFAAVKYRLIPPRNEAKAVMLHGEALRPLE